MQNNGLYVLTYHNGEPLTFYGSLTNVVQLNFLENYNVYLFNYKWFEMGHNKPEEIDNQMTSINMHRTWYDDGHIYLLSKLS